MALGDHDDVNLGHGAGMVEGEDAAVLVDALHVEVSREDVFAIPVTPSHQPTSFGDVTRSPSNIWVMYSCLSGWGCSPNSIGYSLMGRCLDSTASEA